MYTTHPEAEFTSHHSRNMNLQILKEPGKHRYQWEDRLNNTIIELTLTEDGHVDYSSTSDQEGDDDSQWRVGTTGLPPEAADHVWQWYTDIYETASVNDNRSRGVRSFFERTVLFPRRMVRECIHHQTSVTPPLRADWVHWVVDREITLADVDRTTLLIEEEGSTTVPMPR